MLNDAKSDSNLKVVIPLRKRVQQGAVALVLLPTAADGVGGCQHNGGCNKKTESKLDLSELCQQTFMDSDSFVEQLFETHSRLNHIDRVNSYGTVLKNLGSMHISISQIISKIDPEHEFAPPCQCGDTQHNIVNVIENFPAAILKLGSNLLLEPQVMFTFRSRPPVFVANCVDYLNSPVSCAGVCIR